MWLSAANSRCPVADHHSHQRVGGGRKHVIRGHAVGAGALAEAPASHLCDCLGPIAVVEYLRWRQAGQLLAALLRNPPLGALCPGACRSTGHRSVGCPCQITVLTNNGFWEQPLRVPAIQQEHCAHGQLPDGGLPDMYEKAVGCGWPNGEAAWRTPALEVRGVHLPLILTKIRT